MATRLIDIHPHIISPDTQRYPLDPLGGKRSGWSAERPVTFEEYDAAMKAAGIDKAAIVHSSTTYGFDNSYLADAIEGKTDRFAGVYSIDMLADDAEQKMKYWAGRNMSGLRIFTTGSTMPGQAPWLEDPKLARSWGQAGDMGIPVCVQMTKAGIPALEKLLQAHPQTIAIIDHMMKPPIAGGPPYAEAQFLFDLARYKNVYLKFSSRNTEEIWNGKATPETFLGKVVQEFGADRIAWGSNFPAAEDSLADIVAALKRAIAFLPEQDQHWIMAGTAQKLYPTLKD
ncbi:4-sulfomuconolactone hydrolase [Pigmentiphaga humi]|uniref:4-sulfomuconolactone hydrolase n=1 Tax=Pigmentiphaga humi TaxID=2478468 RepID=A0A3P4B1H4_9BURK|nr:amidohydrolase family protein [Pigmentiphaga humi]VCU70134.1 4-sulfomuconolactone hydrolase [Pigmentiphaga humi]